MSTAVLIHTCDKYSWCWPIFFDCLERHWDFSLPTYFVNEEKPYNCRKCEHLLTGRGAWSSRLKLALVKLKDIKNIIYLQEDFWTTKIDVSMLQECVKIHERYRADITKLATNFEFQFDRMASIGRMPINKQKKSSPYVMSHQPIAIFNKGFLLECLLRRGEEGPSEFELGVTDMVNDGTIHCNSICVGNTFMPNRSLIWTIEHGIRKGKVIPEAREFLKRQKYEALIPTEW